MLIRVLPFSDMLGKLASSAKESLGVSDLLQEPLSCCGCHRVKILYSVAEHHAVPTTADWAPE